jgi:hypothetical protein
MKEFEKLMMEFVSQLHAQTAFTPDPLSIGGSNNKNVVNPTTKQLKGVVRVSINMNEIIKLIMEIVSQLTARTVFPPVLYG